MPAELLKAEVVEMICQRYHVTPSQALQEDASILRHMAILNLARGSAEPFDPPVSSPAAMLGLADLSTSLAVTDGV